MNRDDIFAAIDAERQRQEQQWGESHDREHTSVEWTTLLAIRLGKLSEASLDNDQPGIEQRLIQVAAVAVAALEAR